MIMFFVHTFVLLVSIRTIIGGSGLQGIYLRLINRIQYSILGGVCIILVVLWQCLSVGGAVF